MKVLRIIGRWLSRGIARQLRSLRGRLGLILIGLAMVLLGLELVQHANRLDQQRTLTARAQRVAAENSGAVIRARLDDLFRAQEMILRGIGRTPAVSASAYLEDVRQAYQGLDWIQFWRRGTDPIQAVARSYPGYDRADLFETVYKSGGGRYISNVLPTPTQPSRYVIRIASLLKEPGAAQADVLIAMEFSLDGFAQLFAGKTTTGGELLMDGNGSGIYTTGEVSTPERLMQEPEVNVAVREHRAGPIDIRLSKETDLTGYAVPVRESPLTLLYLEGEAPLAGVDRDIWRYLLLPLVIVLVLGIALRLIIQISIRPLTRLSAAARAIGTGDLGFRLEKPEVEEFDGLVSAFNSMAERLEMIQLALVEANEKLEDEKSALDVRVQAATRQLQEEHAKLLRAERLSTLGLFSSAIAHDLRNPLNTVGLTVEWLRIRLADYGDERVRGRVEVMRRELQRSDQIIRTLLGFARTGEPELAPTDLNQLIREVAEVVEPPASVSVNLELDGSLPLVSADRAQLFQVLENLVRNAIQAMPEGGEIRVSSQANCDTCHVAVADNGPGIPADVQAHVFEPLVSSKSTGTGLGLALAKRIVEAHRGRIHVESTPGEGACFEIELPVDPDFT